MNYAEYRDLIRSKGKGVVVFKKLNGDIRKLVFENAKGKVNGGTYSAGAIDWYEPVFDTEISQWRTVNLKTIVSLSV